MNAGFHQASKAPDATALYGKVRTMKQITGKHTTGTTLGVASCVVLLAVGAALLAGKDDIRKFHRMRSM